MNAALNFLGKERYITNSKGEPEFVVIPLQNYKQLIELLEDYGLGQAIRVAEGEKIYNKEEALRMGMDLNQQSL
jgi:hypothetical protein